MTKQRILITLLALFVGTTTTFAQSNQQLNASENRSEDPIMRKMYLGLGLTYQTFQDRKYSDVSYNGAGVALQIGGSRYDNLKILEYGFTANAGLYNANTHDKGGFLFNGTFHVQYQKFITEQLAIGGRLDLLDFQFRKTSGLANNSIYLLTGHHLYGSAVYKKNISDKMVLQVGLDVGLLSFANEILGFAFSAQQTALEEGAFNYQDNAISSPFGYKYFQVEPFWNFVNLRTDIALQFNNRLSVAYQWHARNYTQIKSYGVTIGMHNVIVRYNLVHRPKKVK